ncbi:MFS general substrate transporter [Xylariaceae sp. FL0016]|nr:MFS general substrate transporter [Xylariaceae sp. FL0016]
MASQNVERQAVEPSLTMARDSATAFHAPPGPEVTEKRELELEPPPDGGLQAWLQVLAGHLVVINTWGYMNSYGIFQPYYVEAFGRTASDISWVGSVEIFLVFFVGTFSGRVMDAGYFRPCIFAGMCMLVFGVFMTSLSSRYWHLLLAQGLCQGIGNGLLFCPIIALVSTYFRARRALAISLQASGAATGGMVFPAIAQSLLPRLGFGWTVRIMGFVILFNSAAAFALARTRVPPRKTGAPWIEWAAFREAPYALFSLGTFLTLWGTYYAYYYVRPYARDVLGVDEYTSFSYLLLLNGIGVPARVIPALIADRYVGPVNIFIPTIFFAGVLLFCWIAVDTVPSMWAFVAIFGYFGGGVQALFPASLSSLTSDLSKIGVRIGMVFSIVSVASLSGPPIAGALIRGGSGRPDYLQAQVFGGVVMICGSLFVAAARTSKVGWKLRARM